MVGGHHATLLDGIVEQCQTGSRAAAAAALKAHFLKDIGNAVPDGRRGSKG